MKNATPIEPGLLKVFRLFAVLQFVLTLLIWFAIRHAHRVPPHPIGSALAMVAISVVLLAYLSWPRLEHWLGVVYLPLALGLVAATPFAGQFMFLVQDPNPAEYVEFVKEQIVFLIFPLMLVGWQYSFRWVVIFTLGLGLVDVALVTATFAHTAGIEPDYARTLLTRTVAFLSGGYVITRLMQEQRAQRRALRQANVELAHYAATLEQLTVSRERNRLARELHDTLAHTLSGVAVQLEAAKSLWDSSPGEAHAMLEQSLTATRTGLTETRRALLALRTTPLQDLGLVLSLRGLAEAAAARAGLALDLHLPEHLELPPDMEQGLYRVAQEVLENVVKHAQARRVSVRLAREGGRLTLCVADDGCGFEAARADSDQHYGLRGMFERADIMGGKLQVESQPGRGTTIRLAVEEGRGPRAHL